MQDFISNESRERKRERENMREFLNNIKGDKEKKKLLL